MFFPESRVRVYLYGQAVDMRKSFDGLYAIARAAFTQDPTGGDLYVFVNRRGSQIKVLYFDRSGWCVWAKRLEAGRFIADWSRGAHARDRLHAAEAAARGHRATALSQAISTRSDRVEERHRITAKAIRNIPVVRDWQAA